jgi:hypothetical protein
MRTPKDTRTTGWESMAIDHGLSSCVSPRTTPEGSDKSSRIILNTAVSTCRSDNSIMFHIGGFVTESAASEIFENSLRRYSNIL